MKTINEFLIKKHLKLDNYVKYIIAPFIPSKEYIYLKVTFSGREINDDDGEVFLLDKDEIIDLNKKFPYRSKNYIILKNPYVTDEELIDALTSKKITTADLEEIDSLDKLQ